MVNYNRGIGGINIFRKIKMLETTGSVIQRIFSAYENQTISNQRILLNDNKQLACFLIFQMFIENQKCSKVGKFAA